MASIVMTQSAAERGIREDLTGRADRTPGSECLVLLPPGSDTVRTLPLRGARPGGSVALPAVVSGYGVFATTDVAARSGWRDGDDVVDLAGLGDVYAQPS